MLSINNEFVVLLEKDVLVPILLFEFQELGENPATERITSASYDIDYDGNTYESESNLIGMSIPEGQQELGRDLYSLRFAGARSTVLDSITFNRLVRLSVKMLLKNSETDAMTDTHFDVYRGFSSAMRTSSEGDNLTTTIEFIGDLNDITYFSAYILSESGQARRGQNDTSLKYIGSLDNIQWGAV